MRRWTREEIITSLQDYHETYGDLKVMCLDPQRARRANRNDLAIRYEENKGRWPNAKVVTRWFGSFNFALQVSGIPVLKEAARTPLMVRAMDKTQYDEESGCWEWRGHKQNGRPIIRDGRHPRFAYRVIYEGMEGDVPDGMDLHHTCGNVGCCAPKHLRPLTKADHTRLHNLGG